MVPDVWGVKVQVPTNAGRRGSDGEDRDGGIDAVVDQGQVGRLRACCAWCRGRTSAPARFRRGPAQSRRKAVRRCAGPFPSRRRTAPPARRARRRRSNRRGRRRGADRSRRVSCRRRAGAAAGCRQGQSRAAVRRGRCRSGRRPSCRPGRSWCRCGRPHSVGLAARVIEGAEALCQRRIELRDAREVGADVGARGEAHHVLDSHDGGGERFGSLDLPDRHRPRRHDGRRRRGRGSGARWLGRSGPAGRGPRAGRAPRGPRRRSAAS